jgi:hypothetical protein
MLVNRIGLIVVIALIVMGSWVMNAMVSTTRKARIAACSTIDAIQYSILQQTQAKALNNRVAHGDHLQRAYDDRSIRVVAADGPIATQAGTRMPYPRAIKKGFVSRICGQRLAPVVFPVRDTERVR